MCMLPGDICVCFIGVPSPGKMRRESTIPLVEDGRLSECEWKVIVATFLSAHVNDLGT